MTRDAMKGALVMLALLGAVGCGKSRTEAVVVVTTQGLRIPDDIDAIHAQITDAQNPAPPLFDASYTICSDVITSNCVTLPFTMTLIPGDGKPTDSTRVFIAAQRTGVDRIDDAAVFTFSKGQSLRLDFVLYADCLDVTDCAIMDEACGPNRMCTPIQANPFPGELDLAAGPGEDSSATPNDLAGADLLPAPEDLRRPPPPPDMASFDLANCNHTCVPGHCNSECGDVCTCPVGTVCTSAQPTCQLCGARNQPCCSGDSCNMPLECNLADNNTCECGAVDQPCCPPDNACDTGLMCIPTGSATSRCEPIVIMHMDMGPFGPDMAMNLGGDMFP